MVQIDSKKLDDMQLDEVLNKLQEEKNKREEAREALEKKNQKERIKNLRNLIIKNPALIDVLAPEHRYGRYEPSECSDDDHHRGLSWSGSHKDWPCTRCKLLDLIEDQWVADELRFELKFDLFAFEDY